MSDMDNVFSSWACYLPSHYNRGLGVYFLSPFLLTFKFQYVYESLWCFVILIGKSQEFKFKFQILSNFLGVSNASWSQRHEQTYACLSAKLSQHQKWTDIPHVRCPISWGISHRWQLFQCLAMGEQRTFLLTTSPLFSYKVFVCRGDRVWHERSSYTLIVSSW